MWSLLQTKAVWRQKVFIALSDHSMLPEGPLNMGRVPFFVVRTNSHLVLTICKAFYKSFLIGYVIQLSQLLLYYRNEKTRA